MRYSEDQAPRTRAKIVKEAARRFRKDGISGVGVASVMKGAGLTHGGFYAHFDSKDALVAEACTSAFDDTVAGLRAVVEAAPVGGKVVALVSAYASGLHRDRVDAGCFAAASGVEVRRIGGDVARALARGIDRLLAIASEACNADGCPHRPEAVVSAMVGALLLSRWTGDSQQSEAFLESVRSLW